MTDPKELRRLAAAASTDAPWEFDWFQKEGVADCGIYCKSFSFGSVALFRAPRYVKESDWREFAGYVCAANPKAVTALLDESDRLEALCLDYIAQRAKAEAERDQLRGQLTAIWDAYARLQSARAVPLPHQNYRKRISERNRAINAAEAALEEILQTQALATPHTAATTEVIADVFLGPTEYPVAAADSVQVRTPALISAQPGVSPGGEGVTREQFARMLAFVLDGRNFDTMTDEPEDDRAGAGYRNTKLFWLERAGIVSGSVIILPRPTSPDPARATEEREGK